MKMRTIKLTPKFLMEALQGKASSVASNLPIDAQLLDMKFDLSSNQISAIIRSDTFENVPELYPIPEFRLKYSPTTSESIAASVATEKIQTKQTINLNTEPIASKATESSNTAIKMAGEFTPEQRKLLSFKAEGEYVIVKPTQFLKEEWEEINEVVRSLGGKWVKGDIISYWQIPTQ